MRVGAEVVLIVKLNHTTGVTLDCSAVVLVDFSTASALALVVLLVVVAVLATARPECLWWPA